MIGIETTRFSKTIKSFIEARPNSIIKIDGVVIKKPIDEWCTNKALQKYKHLEIIEKNQVILGYFDHPFNLWASDDQENLLSELHKAKILNYSFIRKKPGILHRLLAKLGITSRSSRVC